MFIDDLKHRPGEAVWIIRPLVIRKEEKCHKCNGLGYFLARSNNPNSKHLKPSIKLKCMDCWGKGTVYITTGYEFKVSIKFYVLSIEHILTWTPNYNHKTGNSKLKIIYRLASKQGVNAYIAISDDRIFNVRSEAIRQAKVFNLLSFKEREDLGYKYKYG